MPGTITHLKIAYLYNEANHGIYNERLYLGAISPDSVNLYGQAPKQKRWPAHLRHADLDVWSAKAKLFYDENKSLIDQSYLRGYILHILTDIVWDKSFNFPLYKKLHDQGVADCDLKTERWNELYGYEQGEVSKAWFKDDVLLKLKKAQALPVGSLNCEEIAGFCRKTIALDFPTGKPPIFVNEDMVLKLFSEVLSLANQIFK